MVVQYSGRIRQALLNHQYHYLRMRVDDNDDLSASSIFTTLEQTLQLNPSQPHPYKYRRSSIEFDVGHWNPKEFAVGVSAIADAIGPNPYVENAYVKSFEGDIEKLTPFFNLKSFLDHIDRRASSFGEVSILLRARDKNVGISVPTDHKKLRIRTSLTFNEVDPLLAAWPSGLRLKQVKAIDTGNIFTGGEPTKKEESNWVKFGVPVAVALITAFSVTSLIALKKSIWPEQKLVISSPILSGENNKWVGKRVEIDWYLQPEQPSFRSIRKDAPATVQIMDSAGQQRELTSKPPVKFEVSPGFYSVAVSVEELPTARFRLKVEAPEK